MDPRTFLPPKRIPTAAVLKVGDPAPKLSISDGAVEPPFIVLFLRHVGCPFAEATVRAVDEVYASSPIVPFVLVSHGTEHWTNEWCEAIDCPKGAAVMVDHEREVYATWGLGLTGLGHFFGKQSLSAVMALARRGIRNRHPSGSRWQGAGSFAVDSEGIIRWRHLPAHAGDLPDLSEAVRAIGGG